MHALQKAKAGLDKRFQKVLHTPASYDLFVAIHDFIEYIELNALLSRGLSRRSKKSDREVDITTKYAYLRQIYQGLEDIHAKSNTDLGHARYWAIRELNQIKSKDWSEGNSFWKKREVARKLTGVVYQRLEDYLSDRSANVAV